MEKKNLILDYTINLFALALKVAHSHLWMNYVTSNTVFNKKENDFSEPVVFCLLLVTLSYTILYIRVH